jgi:hypothetical protein
MHPSRKNSPIKPDTMHLREGIIRCSFQSPSFDLCRAGNCQMHPQMSWAITNTYRLTSTAGNFLTTHFCSRQARAALAVIAQALRACAG